jgi:TonB family protein
MEVEFKGADEERVVLFLNDSTGKPLVKGGQGEWTETIKGYRQDPPFVTGQFRHYKPDGQWTLEFATGRKIVQEFYNKGRFDRGTVFGTSFDGNAKVPSDGPKIVIAPLPYKFYITEHFMAMSGVDFKTYPKLKTIKVGNVVLKNPPEEASSDQLYVVTESPALPPGGVVNMMKFIKDNLKYPATARKARVEGSVFVEFVVEKNGELVEFKVNKGLQADCDEEALRVMKLFGASQPWNPAMQNGKPVRVRYIIPVKFSSF